MIVFITVWILLARPLLAWEAIAHRGVYHNMGDAHALAENSIEALLRAYDIGVRGVEFDLRLASDGGVLVVHDAVSNRVTADDNFGGVLNPIDVALNIQSPAPPISFDQLSASSWVNTPLKVFGANGRIVPPTGGTVPRLVTLDTLLARFKPLGGPEFWLFLDIEDPITLRSAGALVRKYALESVVFLKFFAGKAINSTNYRYSNFATCYQYAADNNLAGLQIVPQINDGELTYTSGGIAHLSVFQTTLSINEYLQCWADAQQAHSNGGAALMPIVSASVPGPDNKNYQLAYQAALDAMNWAKANGRLKMSIVPNPDAGRKINTCTLWKWEGSGKATQFDTKARESKFKFATGPANADFIIIDLMCEVMIRRCTSDFNTFVDYLC